MLVNARTPEAYKETRISQQVMVVLVVVLLIEFRNGSY